MPIRLIVATLVLLFYGGSTVGWAENRLLLITVATTGEHGFWQRGYPSSAYFTLSPQIDSLLTSIERKYALKRVDGWPIKTLGVYCSVLALQPGVDREETLVKIRQEPEVRLAQPMQVFEVLADGSAIQVRSYFDLQYGKHAESVRKWHQQVTGLGVKIAIIDTGVDRRHPGLKSRIEFSENFVGDGEFDTDVHGTAIAGIVASNAGKNGAVGLAPDAKLYALKACWPEQKFALKAHCNSFTLAKALSSALEQQVHLINLSLSGPQDPLLAELLTVALQKQVLVIAARRNPNDFPASMAGVIAVRNGASHGRLAWIHANSLQADAEADEIFSTAPGGSFDFFSGSSMAAARISGLTALILQQQHTLTPQAAMQGIQSLVNSYHVAKRDD